MRTQSTITTPDGITWYYEQEGTGPHIVLIPDGIGDCALFSKPVSLIAAAGFTVTTFDMPGMSRSAHGANTPPESYQDITAPKLARYVISLLDALHIDDDAATFWGSSSGGATVLALAAGYPDRVRNGIVHEVPTTQHDFFEELLQNDDESIAKTLAAQMPALFVGDAAAWDALGDDVHARLWRNYSRWARGYPRTLPQSVPTVPVGGSGGGGGDQEQEEEEEENEDRVRRPLDWTVGAGTPMGMFFDNVVTAAKAGVSIGLLPGMHLPYVSHPEAFARHVVDTTRKYL